MSLLPNPTAGLVGQVTATVAAAATKSAAIPMNGAVLVGCLFRALVSTALTFEVCDTLGGTYVPLKTAVGGTTLSYTVAANTYAAIDPKDFVGVQFLKLVFGSSETAGATIVCSLKG